MTAISLDRIVSIEAKRHELSDAMAAGNLSTEDFIRLSKEYAQIEPVAAAAREVRRLHGLRGSGLALTAVGAATFGLASTLRWALAPRKMEA